MKKIFTALLVLVLGLVLVGCKTTEVSEEKFPGSVSINYSFSYEGKIAVRFYFIKEGTRTKTLTEVPEELDRPKLIGWRITSNLDGSEIILKPGQKTPKITEDTWLYAIFEGDE